MRGIGNAEAVTAPEHETAFDQARERVAQTFVTHAKLGTEIGACDGLGRLRERLDDRLLDADCAACIVARDAVVSRLRDSAAISR